MRLAGLKLNDCVDGEGISVSLWTQGCPHKCKGCHNPETWDFNGGYEDETNNIRGQIVKALSANNTQRNFSILGGEPLCEQNKEDVLTILACVAYLNYALVSYGSKRPVYMLIVYFVMWAIQLR